MKLPVTLQKQIIDFLLSLPNMYSPDSQRAFLYHVGIDPELDDQIPFGKPPIQFVPLVVSILVKYGKLNDGQYALEAMLETSKSYVGQDKKTDCDALIHALHTELQQQKVQLQNHLKEDEFPMNENMDFTKKINHIERLLKKEEYTDSATRCVIIIDQALRQVVHQHLENVDAETKRKVHESVQKRDRRGGGIQSLTMGEVVHVLREAKFFDSWAQNTGRDLSSLQIIDLDKLTALRNKFAHQDQQASPDEAKLLLQCLKVILSTFEVNYEDVILSEPAKIVLQSDQGERTTEIQKLINIPHSEATCQIMVKSSDASKTIEQNMTFRDMVLDDDESNRFRLGSKINICYSYSGLTKHSNRSTVVRDMDFQDGDLSPIIGKKDVEMTIFDLGTTGKLTILMPDHLLEEGRIYQFPDVYKNQSITLTGATGTETVIALATLKDLDFRTKLHLDKQKKAQIFSTIEAEQLVKQLNGIVQTLPENSWAIGSCTFEITN